jgi:integrase
MGELLGLRWADIDVEQGHLQVNRTALRLSVDDAKMRMYETEPKTESSRRLITLPQLVVDTLRRHRAAQRAYRLSQGSAYQDLDLVFANATGGHLWDSTVRRQLYKLLKGCKLPPMRFHDLRHSAATILISLGVNIKVIQELLGHSNIQTTLNIYGHVIPGLQAQAMQQLDDLYQQNG